MIILGIDPSLNSTGWGLIKKDQSKLIFISSGILVPPSTNIPEKLYFISQNIAEIIKSNNPKKIAIEETFVNLNPQSSLKLGLVRGAIIVTAMQHDIDVIEVSPNFIKKTVTGNGKAEKRQVAFMISKIISGIPKEHSFKGEDETDALAAAYSISF